MIYTIQRFHRIFIIPALLVLFLLLSVVGYGQKDQNCLDCTETAHPIYSQNILSDTIRLCAGNDTTFHIGYDASNDIVIAAQEPRIDSAKRMFIPDGLPCGEDNSCVYSSPITISGYSGTIQSAADDILYVRLNLEHSNAADLNIRLVCPNDLHKATILKLGNTQNISNLCPVLNGEEKGWSTPNVNVVPVKKFGISDDSSECTCDSTASNNIPGPSGYDYCWSNNTSVSYSPVGVIYGRQGTTTNLTSNVFNASDTSNSTNNFYLPDENFSFL